jgi:hypothetical protein
MHYTQQQLKRTCSEACSSLKLLQTNCRHPYVWLVLSAVSAQPARWLQTPGENSSDVTLACGCCLLLQGMPIDSSVAELITAQLFVLSQEAPDPIYFYINSTGIAVSVDAVLVVYSTWLQQQQQQSAPLAHTIIEKKSARQQQQLTSSHASSSSSS